MGNNFDSMFFWSSCRNEAKLIRLIVKRILTEANKTSLFVAKHPVGLDYRMANVMKMLDIEAQGDAIMVGIHGMGGMGKTTLAKAVYNQISTHFDVCSFISNVREAAKQFTGLVSLQQQLLCDVVKDDRVKVKNTSDGIGIIRQRIQNRKVLLVLDDVDDESQLHAFGLEWFCSGSRIIVTTRDERVLTFPTLPQTRVYELKELDAAQSLQLFSWHAFGKEEPNAEFAMLSKEVTATAAGLPLALKIFGSHFFDLKTIREWGGMLEKLKKGQHKHVYEQLKISYDVLDEEVKKVFLDIACFFIGKEREHATLMWEGCGFLPEMTIKVLMCKSLVNINDDTGEFEMHDQIRDMARKIVQDEIPYQGMCCSRLWKDDETLDVLQNKQGTINIEAVHLDWHGIGGPKYVEAESLAAMSQLRMLWLGRDVRLEGEYEHFPRMLKWLKWCMRDLDSLPGALWLENIVILDLSESSITRVWNPQTSARIKLFKKLKVLKLNGCKNLTICPNFKSMPHLEKLYLNDCVKMTELHPTIGLLKSLTHLKLCNCQLLKELPEEIYELTSLEELDLSDCSKITTFPSPLGDSKSLAQPLLSKMKTLYLCSCKNLTTCPDFTSMPHLEILNFEGCENISELHPSIGNLKSLTNLYLSSWHSLKELPQEIWQLTALKVLDLSYCSEITNLPSQVGDIKSLKQPLFGKLESLSLSCCDNFTICPDFTSMPRLEILDLSGCAKMSEIHPSIWLLKSLTNLDLSNCEALKELPEELSQLTLLERLVINDCDEIIALPESIRHLKQLKYLSLKDCSSLTDIPECIVLLDQIETLTVARCERLKFLPQFLPSLTRLNASDCYQLEMITDVSSLKGLQAFNLSGCERLVDVPGIHQLKCLKRLKLGGCRSLHDSFWEGLQEANFQNLLRFSISGILTNGEPSCARYLSFLLPKQFKAGVLYLYAKESILNSSLLEIENIFLGLDEGSGTSELNESIDGSEEHRGLLSDSWEDEIIPWDEVGCVDSFGSDSSVASEENMLPENESIDGSEEQRGPYSDSWEEEIIAWDEVSCVDSYGSDPSVASEENMLPVDSQGRVIRIEITADDVQFSFSASVKWNASKEFPVAKFGNDSELMTMVRNGRFVGDDDAKKRRTMMMMRVSIDGCVLLDGDLFTNKHSHIYEDELHLCPSEASRQTFVVKLH